MDLPTPQVLELETILRQRDTQVAELTVRLACPQPIATVLTLRRVLIG